jgi:rSAM/selenodomain-associated transferase 2
VKLAIIVPMLDEAGVIGKTLSAIRAGAPQAQVVAVDGGSSDQTVAIAQSLADVVISSERGRARQMNAGVAVATGTDVLAFVHADTIVPHDFARQIETALASSKVVGGRFDLALDDPASCYRLLGGLISARSRLMRSATGDQAIFVRRAIFARLGGFREIEVCEDVDFVRRLRRVGRIACPRATVVTSARRWREHGMVRTILLMWTIKLLFLSGVSPHWIKRFYDETR